MFRRTTLISLAALLCGLGSSAAQADMTCTQAPDCASLGYTQTEAECASKPSIKCPFDTSKYYCKKTPVVEGCTVGSYLYTDKSCSSTYDYNRTVVGIVFDPVKKLAVLVGGGAAAVWLPEWYVYFSQNSTEGMEYCSLAQALVDCGTDGKANTKKLGIYPNLASIEGQVVNVSDLMEQVRGLLPVQGSSWINLGSASLAQAVPSSQWYGYGHWFIPSRKELQTIYDNRNEIFHKTMDAIGFASTIYLSSTLNDYQTYLGIYGDGRASGYRFTSLSERPTFAVISYGDTSPLTDVDWSDFNMMATSSSNGYICAIDKDGELANACVGYEYVYNGQIDCYGIKGSDGRYRRYVRWCDKCNKQFYQCCNSAYQSGCEAVD